MSDIIVIDTEDGIEHYRMCAIIGALRIEINTGMKVSRSSLIKSANHFYGIKAGTKQKCLEKMLELYKNTYGRDYGGTK